MLLAVLHISVDYWYCTLLVLQTVFHFIRALLMLLYIISVTSGIPHYGCYQWHCTWLLLLMLCVTSIDRITR
jgi:hypothetical protein